MTALLFLDVDGTLIPYDGWRLAEPSDVSAGRPEQPHASLGRINVALGPRLRGLPAELMWATGWLHDANEFLDGGRRAAGPFGSVERSVGPAWSGTERP